MMARVVAPAIVVLLCASVAPPSSASTPELSRLAGLLHAELQERRASRGSSRLEREAGLDAAALVIAREVAERSPKKRLRGRLRALQQAKDAGAMDLAWADARVFLMRGSTTPVDEVVRQWSTAPDSWSTFLKDQTLRYGLGATRARDGWIVVVALLGRTRAETADSGLVPPSTEALRAMEARARSLVLGERRRRGLAHLVRDGELDRLARLHSLDMAQRGLLTHEGSDGSDVSLRLARAKLFFRRVSENVALVSSEDPALRAFRGWMESPGHRANILDPAMTRTGVGVAWNPDGSYFFTQIFTKPVRGR